MKKLLSLITLAAVMMVGLAGNAMAYFEAGSLIRVVYQTTGDVEVVTDLGSGADLVGSSNALVGTGADAFSLSQFGGAAYGDLKVAYMYSPTIDVSTSPMSFSGPVDTATLSGDRKGSGLSGNYGTFIATYSGDDSTVVGSKSTLTGYYQQLNVTNFAGFLLNTVVETSLADLATVGYVEQPLYAYANINVKSIGVAVATIRTLADGTTLINPAAISQVPVPASFLLFGSGLLGLFGIRRKNA